MKASGEDRKWIAVRRLQKGERGMERRSKSSRREKRADGEYGTAPHGRGLTEGTETYIYMYLYICIYGTPASPQNYL